MGWLIFLLILYIVFFVAYPVFMFWLTLLIVGIIVISVIIYKADIHHTEEKDIIKKIDSSNVENVKFEFEEYEETVNGEIDKVNKFLTNIDNYIKNLQKNKKLIRIVKNFIHNKDFHKYFNSYENAIKPTDIFNYNERIYSNLKKVFFDEKNQPSKFIKFIFNQNYTLIEKTFKNNTIEKYSSKFTNLTKTYDLFEAIQEEQIINTNSSTEYFISFVFVLYFEWRENVIRNVISILEDNNLDEYDDTEIIIRELYENGYNKNKIIDVLSIRAITLEENELYIDQVDVYEYIFEENIKKIKNKNKISKLLKEDYIEIENKISIDEIDLMSGYEFEKFIVRLFQNMGYQAYQTKESNDQGVDVVAKKKDFVVAIQTKCYSGVVGNSAIQEAVAGAKYYDANKAMVITNSHFTKSAINLANKNNVELWDRQVLIKKIDEIL